MAQKRKKSTNNILPFESKEVHYGSKEYENIFYSHFTKYTYNTTDKDCKTYAISYLKEIHKYYDYYTSIPDKKYHPYGIYIKMQRDNIILPETEKRSLTRFIDELDSLNVEHIKRKEQALKQRTNLESKKINEALSFIEYFIDSQIYNIIANKKVNSDILDTIHGYEIRPTFLPSFVLQATHNLDKTITELQSAKNKEDIQLVEGYEHLTAEQLLMYIDFLKKLKDKISTNITKTHTHTRKIKPKKPEQLVKKLQIQDTCDVLHISSCNKMSIMDSNLLFLYNTKTREFIKYVSTSKFSVNGSTLVNVDTSNSFKKKVRAPETTLKTINHTNIKFMQRLWSSLKTKECAVKPRVNKHCVLLSCLNTNSNGT